MTTLDPANDISSDLYRGLAYSRESRRPLPVMAIFHFCAILGVALICHALVH